MTPTQKVIAIAMANYLIDNYDWQVFDVAEKCRVCNRTPSVLPNYRCRSGSGKLPWCYCPYCGTKIFLKLSSVALMEIIGAYEHAKKLEQELQNEN